MWKESGLNFPLFFLRKNEQRLRVLYVRMRIDIRLIFVLRAKATVVVFGAN